MRMLMGRIRTIYVTSRALESTWVTDIDQCIDI